MQNTLILDVFGVQKLRIQRHTMQERAGAYASRVREEHVFACTKKAARRHTFSSSGCNGISSET